MNVLLLTPTAAPGGAERALLALGRHLPSEGLTPYAVTLAPGPIEEWFADVGLPMRVIPTGRTRYLVSPLRTVLRLRTLMRALAIDVVVSNQSKGHVYGGIAARLAGIPAVWWEQGIPSARGRIERMAARVPAAAVVCSSDDALAAQRALTPHTAVRKVHLGVPVDEIARHRGRGKGLRVELGWDGHPIIGIVGRLQPWKGQTTFLHAAALVANEFPAARFAIVGGAILGWEGAYPRQLEQLARDLGIGDRVHFTGHQPDVYPWFDALDVVVHASFGEPFGLVLVEAMALGKVLVAAASGGPLEIVEDGVSGLLVPPGRPEDLARAVARVLGDSSLAAALRSGARARAPMFSEERMTAAYADVLREVLSTR